MIDRQDDLRSWVVVLRRLVEDKRIQKEKIFAFADNHCAGHAPATVKQFFELWDKDEVDYSPFLYPASPVSHLGDAHGKEN